MILITGFPYIRENYFATFCRYPDSDGIIFLLPEIWKIKKGKVVFRPPKQKNVYTTRTFFHHSDYPVIGGLLKGWMPFFPFALWRLKKEKKVDLVYACSEPNLLSTFYFNFWSKLYGLKCINFTWENVSYRAKSSGFKWFFKKIILKLNLAFSDGVVCGNNKGAAIYKKLTGKPIAVIPMSGVDTNFFTPSDKNGKDRRFKGVNLNDKIIFSFAGAISYRKGIHLMLESLKEVLIKLPNSFLIIAGSGEYEKEIDGLVEKFGLRDYILRVPWLNQSELKELLSVSDVFLYPSLPFKGWEEQFGYSMAEASLMELPVISTRSGSIEDIVEDNHTGVLIKPDNTDELKNAMIKLGNDRNLRSLLGREGRRYIVENFSHEVVANKFYQFFNKFRS